jgi:2-oxoglutarate ferredoxin oxidoreductase subunit gamma
MTKGILIAGFGGQGALFVGKILAYCGMIEDKQLSWLPSYGPEMRGGTANCSVWISDEPVGSPQVTEPDYLIAMNYPSYAKFIDKVVEGGKVSADSTFIEEKSARTDINQYLIPAGDIVTEKGLGNAINMVLLGKLLKETELFSLETVQKAMEKCLPPKKAKFIEINMNAIRTGFDS